MDQRRQHQLSAMFHQTHYEICKYSYLIVTGSLEISLVIYCLARQYLRMYWQGGSRTVLEEAPFIADSLDINLVVFWLARQCVRIVSRLFVK